MRRTSQRPKELHDPAIIVVLLGSAPCRFTVGALTDGRSPGGFTPEATVAARRGNTADASVWCLRHHPQCAARRLAALPHRVRRPLARRFGGAPGRATVPKESRFSPVFALSLAARAAEWRGCVKCASRGLAGRVRRRVARAGPPRSGAARERAVA